MLLISFYHYGYQYLLLCASCKTHSSETRDNYILFKVNVLMIEQWYFYSLHPRLDFHLDTSVMSFTLGTTPRFICLTLYLWTFFPLLLTSSTSPFVWLASRLEKGVRNLIRVLLRWLWMNTVTLTIESFHHFPFLAPFSLFYTIFCTFCTLFSLSFRNSIILSHLANSKSLGPCWVSISNSFKHLS